MPLPRRRIPVWVMGLTNLTYGMYGGIVAFAIPQLLSNRHVPESAIAGLTAVALTPGFWAFLFSPVLDVRLSRRSYAVLLAALASASLLVALMNLAHLAILEVVLTLGYFAVYLYQSAIGGWYAGITTREEENTLSIWFTVANCGGFGLMAMLCNQLASHLAPLAVAIVVAALTLLPTLAFPLLPAPGPDRRLAKESFLQFSRDIVALVKRPSVLTAVLLFALPAGTFSLTNFLGALGNDFHASPAFVGVVAGAGATIGGLAGCFLFRPLSRLMPLRPLYLVIGAVGAMLTFALILLPHAPATLAIALIGENLFQNLAITNSTAVIFETIGRDNPLASTTFCFICSAYCFPISYMLYVDAFGYHHLGAAGSFAADASTGLVACLLLGGMLYWLARRPARPPGQTAAALAELDGQWAGAAQEE